MPLWYPDALAFLANLFWVFLALNLAAWAAIKCAPGFFVSLESRMHYDPGVWYRTHFAAEPVHQWYGLSEREFEEYLAEITAHNYEYAYDPFCEYRHNTHQGRYLNVSEHGFRLGAHQGPWPPDPANCNIFVFGGSTAFGVGADWHTVPSLLQEALDGRLDGPQGRPVRCYNFGRFAYYSSQEKTLFTRLLTEGFRPDLALFFHGLNDCVRAEGGTAVAGIYTEALRAHNSMHREFAQNRLKARVKWIRLWLFASSLPLLRLAEDLGRHLAGRDETPLARLAQTGRDFAPGLSAAQCEAVVGRLLLNHRQILEVARLSGVRCLFALQPHPAYKYDLSLHRAHVAELGLRGNERAGEVYPGLRRALAAADYAPEALLDLSDMQERLRENLYLDEAHYTAHFSAHIARRLAEHLLSRPDLTRPGQRN
ncbi:MAG: hypothetical protein KKA55_00770 [Proteobacteria bacterium]|nr:hypothetical protein [Pseudomonadota bacterium]MBU1594049.1 hypothetical protein [Pseudomonadota bacterium]